MSRKESLFKIYSAPFQIFFILLNLSMSSASISNSNSKHVNQIPSNNIEEIKIGGGCINEKERNYGKQRQGLHKETDDSSQNVEMSESNFDPQSKLPHLLHALVGLERYPNYISRWNYNLEKDVERLERALEEQLNKVRQQKQSLMHRNFCLRKLIEEAREASKIDNDDDNDNIDWSILNPPKEWQYIQDKVLDPRCARAIFQSKFFLRKNKPSLSEVLEGKIAVELDGAQCEEWLDQEMFDVYSFPLLLPSFCEKVKKLMKKLIHLQEEKRKSEQANDDNTLGASIGFRPIDVDMIGISWLNDLLFHLIVRPLSWHLFQTTESMEDLDWRQGYIVGYSHSPSGKDGAQRQRLVPHTDDSEVTLNIGMGDHFEGGDLNFWGLRNSKNEGSFVGEFHPVIGTALIHAGRHLHEVQSVTKGNRFAYIIWARSWQGTRSMTCPCCWLNRRQQISTSAKPFRNSCICNSGWN